MGADRNFEQGRKPTRRDEFLETMGAVAALTALRESIPELIGWPESQPCACKPARPGPARSCPTQTHGFPGWYSGFERMNRALSSTSLDNSTTEVAPDFGTR